MSKFRVRYRHGTGSPSSFLRGHFGREEFDSIDEAHATVMLYQKTLTAPDNPPLLWLPPSVQIEEIPSPMTVRRYQITTEGPVPLGDEQEEREKMKMYLADYGKDHLPYLIEFEVERETASHVWIESSTVKPLLGERNFFTFLSIPKAHPGLFTEKANALLYLRGENECDEARILDLLHSVRQCWQTLSEMIGEERGKEE
jgi:hypothetical protein